MDINATIPDIEARLRSAGISINDFCSSVGVHRATWQRWKSGAVSPRLDTWRRVLAELPTPQEARAE